MLKLRVLGHTVGIYGLPRVRTELNPTADNPILGASSSTKKLPIA